MSKGKFDLPSLDVIFEVKEWNFLDILEMLFSLMCNDYCLQAKLYSICPSFAINPVCTGRGSKNSGDRLTVYENVGQRYDLPALLTK